MISRGEGSIEWVGEGEPPSQLEAMRSLVAASERRYAEETDPVTRRALRRDIDDAKDMIRRLEEDEARGPEDWRDTLDRLEAEWRSLGEQGD
jgi:rubrerythrin